jgi:hypothetical protein
MKIQNIKQENLGSSARISADVIWEDSDRSAQNIYFEVRDPFCEALTCTPHAFLVPALIPAMRHGEKRVSVEGAICPHLRDGLETAMGWIHKWHGPARKPVRIEGGVRNTSPLPLTPTRAGCFFTGGIDSLATVRRNRSTFPMEHPGSFKDAIIIYGLEVDRPEVFEDVLRALSAIAEDASLTLLPVYSNIRTLDEDWWFWEFEWEGSVYSAVAHALTRRLTTVSIASTYDIPNMHELGSHPLLDPNYGSSDLRVLHDGITLSRLQKTKLLVNWEVALRHLRVCNTVQKYRPRTINCGQCEKCIRTKLALLALGVLDKATAFVENNVPPELVLEAVHVHSPYMEACYRELLPLLVQRGRHDLVESINRVIARDKGELGWKGYIKRLDQRFLNGTLLQYTRSRRASNAKPPLAHLK